MTDRELLRKLMYLYDWNQKELAKQLGFDRSNVSKVLKEIQALSKERRQLAEELLKKKGKALE